MIIIKLLVSNFTFDQEQLRIDPYKSRVTLGLETHEARTGENTDLPWPGREIGINIPSGC